MIEFACHYAAQRYRVFPLAAGGKIPVIPRARGGHGCLDATTDMAVIERWWTEYPDANVGIATGRGLLVLDIDPRHNAKWLEALQQLSLPQTLTVRTWSGGWHLYFSMPASSGITVGTDLLPGIDWRGNNGYVVAAGSIVEGAIYTIAKKVAIAPAPRALIERIEGSRRNRRETVRSTRKVEQDGTGRMVIPITRRNDTLMRIGSALRRWGIEFNSLYESLRAINADHAEQPLSDDEVRQIAASVARYEPKGAA